MAKKFDSIVLGLVLGLIFPLVATILYQKIMFPGYEYDDFLFRAFLIGVHIKVISVCVFPNLLIFFVFIWTNRLKSSRGVLLATLIYALVIFGINMIPK